MNTITVPVRVLGYDSRVSTKNGQTYSDLSARFGTKIVKLAVDHKKGFDFTPFIDKDVNLVCEVVPAFQTQIATLRALSVEPKK